MVPKWRFLHPVFPVSRMQHVSDLHSKFAQGLHHLWGMVDIQSAAAEIRRGKKRKKDRRKETTGQKYIGQP